MWERYSYYANRSLLVLFLVSTHDGFSLGDAEAAAIYGLFTAATYLAGLPGGWIGDRILGTQPAVIVGGSAILIGNVVLAATATPAAFYMGLMVIVCGVGLLKPNISAMVAALYRDQPERLDSAFTLYYMGVCTGSALAAIIAPLAAARWGWRIGYAVAALGMSLGLLVFLVNRRALGASGRRPLDPINAGLVRKVSFMAAVLVLVVAGSVCWHWAGAVSTARGATFLIGLTATAYFYWALFLGAQNRIERDQIIVIAVLCATCALFWSGADLAGSALNLFAERHTQRQFELGGYRFEVPAAAYQSINPALIIALSPVLSVLWLSLAGRRRPTSSAEKFAIGLVFCAAGLAVMAVAGRGVASGLKVGSEWLITTYVLHTVGELCISPLGLAAINRLTPVRLAGQMMGIWFLSVSLGTIIASQIAGAMSAEGAGGGASQYGLLAAVTTAFALLLWLARGRLEALSHLEDE
jgi:proton-dependent oligopeptide transporter, POT family